MQEISNVIGAGRLDAFIDFRRCAVQRVRVESLDQTLPEEDKLAAEQKDAMALVLARDFDRQMQDWRARGQGTARPFGLPMAS